MVIRAVKNTARNGRTVVVTIHQPSIEIFEAFDALVREHASCKSDLCTVVVCDESGSLVRPSEAQGPVIAGTKLNLSISAGAASAGWQGEHAVAILLTLPNAADLCGGRSLH